MRHRALIVLAVSGILGFRIGMITLPDWQVAVETAQVTAGVVVYPAATPFFLYHAKLWTILHQLLAIGLRAGFSEWQLSLFVSGLLGMVSFQALSMFVWALSEDALASLAAPLLIVLTRAADFGVVYPIILAGAVHTYGIIGLSLFVLVVALLGAGCYRTGAFLLALAPSVHPSLGLWLWIVCGAAFAWDIRGLWDDARHALRYFIAGGIVTAASLAVQLASAYSPPPIDAAAADRYLAAFVALWDMHRQPATMAMDGVALNRGALALAVFWLVGFAEDLPKAARFLLRVVIVAAVLSLLTVVVSWVPPAKLPPALLVLMPTRLANFNAMTFVALLLGLICAYRATWWSRVLAVLLSAGLVLGERSMFWRWQRPGLGPPAWSRWFEVWWVLGLVAVVLTAVVAARWRRAAPAPVPSNRFFLVPVALALVAAIVVPIRAREPARATIFNDRNNMVFREAARGSGLLITGGNLSLIQLRTRRPLLLNGGGFDGLAYSIDSAPETERILHDVYEIDFFNPPEEARHAGVLPPKYNQAVWEQFTLEKWQAIRYMYQAEQVMTPATWSLNLPVAAQDRDLRLYQIPP